MEPLSLEEDTDNSPTMILAFMNALCKMIQCRGWGSVPLAGLGLGKFPSFFCVLEHLTEHIKYQRYNTLESEDNEMKSGPGSEFYF